MILHKKARADCPKKELFLSHFALDNLSNSPCTSSLVGIFSSHRWSFKQNEFALECKNKFGQWSRTVRAVAATIRVMTARCWLCDCQHKRSAFQILFCKFSVPNGAVWFYACLVILQWQMSPFLLYRHEKQPVQWSLLLSSHSLSPFSACYIFLSLYVTHIHTPLLCSLTATNATLGRSLSRRVLKVFRNFFFFSGAARALTLIPRLKLINGSLSHWNQSWGWQKWN